MVCLALATPGTKACDAAGGALRPQWRVWPAPEFWASLPTTSSQTPQPLPFALPLIARHQGEVL